MNNTDIRVACATLRQAIDERHSAVRNAIDDEYGCNGQDADINEHARMFEGLLFAIESKAS